MSLVKVVTDGDLSALNHVKNILSDVFSDPPVETEQAAVTEVSLINFTHSVRILVKLVSRILLVQQV